MSRYGLNSIRNIFDDLRETTDTILKLQNRTAKNLSKINGLPEKLTLSSEKELFVNKAEKIRENITDQAEKAKNYCFNKDGYISTLDEFDKLRKKLVESQRFLMAVELELYGMRCLKKVEIAQFLGLPLRTVENHIQSLITMST